MVPVFVAMDKFKGTALVEVLQNCVIFNDGAYSKYTDKTVKEDVQLHVEHGKPMIFGKNKDKGLILDGLKLKVVTIGEDGITEDDILVHDAREKDKTLHLMLAGLKYPLVTGIIRSVEELTFGERERALAAEVKNKSKFNTPDDLFVSGETYTVS